MFSLSEEQRILYVALTRAKEKLYITGRSKDFTKYVPRKTGNRKYDRKWNQGADYITGML